MSLGLVSYDDSEESDSEEVESKPVNNKNDPAGEPSSSRSTLVDSTADRILAPAIRKEPAVNEGESKKHTGKSVNFPLPESKLSTLNSDIDVKCLTSSGSRSGPVKITIPSLNDVEEDIEPTKKKIKPSQKGSGLFALLPNPKSALVPQSVAQRTRNVPHKKPAVVAAKPPTKAPKAPAAIKQSLTHCEDSGDEDEPSGTVDFFSLESKEENVVHAPVDFDMDLPAEKPTESNVPKDKNDESLSFSSNFQPSQWKRTSAAASSSSVQPVDQYTTSEFMTVSNNELELDEEAMQQLCGRRDRLKMQEVNLIDVSGDAIMPDSREWLTKQLTEETTQRSNHKKRDGPTTQQKRKHQITYLAFQAKENELELKNQWANNRVSRKQTQAKYGF